MKQANFFYYNRHFLPFGRADFGASIWLLRFRAEIPPTRPNPAPDPTYSSTR